MNKKKLKIAHVLKSSVYSGAENVVITIMKKLEGEFDFIYIASEGTIRKRLIEEKVPFMLLKHFDKKQLTKVIGECQPDVIHAHDFSATVYCAALKGRGNLISHLHYDPLWSRKWNLKTLLYARAARNVRCILTVSEKSYRNMVFADCLEEKQMVVGNPIDVEHIKKMGQQNILPDKYDLIFVGRLVEQKNPQRFLGLIKKLYDKSVFVKCAMLGQGEFTQECKQLICSYGLENQVDMIGYQENPYIYMKSAKILCMTSRWEGYGLVALEANVLGIPVLSTRTAGTEEVLGDDAQELCSTDEEFLEKINMLLNNAEEYERWREKAERRVTNIVKLDDYMEIIVSVYHEILRGTKE